MKNKLLLTSTAIFITAAVFISSCKKDSYVNPYDDPSLRAPENPDPNNIPSDNFAYLQYKIFKPTCANSGCHDGTFAPDFRSIYSSYNTLVYQNPVKNIVDTDNPYFYKYRVWPFKADSSVIYKRLLFHKDGEAEKMPLYGEVAPFYPYPYWTGNESAYINLIKNWINAGAKDMFGNYPMPGNARPQITGLLGFNSGSTSGSFSRGGGQYPPLEVPAGNIDIWFLISDDSTHVSNISYLQCKVMFDMYDTTGAITLPIVYEPTVGNRPTGSDFANNSGQVFTHKVTINTSAYPSNKHLFLRAFIDDNSQGSVTEIPGDGSAGEMMGYFALKVQ